jgi:ribokinase
MASPADNPARPKVCVVGSVNLDLVVHTPRLPLAGETVLGGVIETYPGGKGANQAVAAARMGAEVSLVASVGDDDAGRELRGVLEREGLDLTHLLTRPRTPTGRALVTVAEGGDNTIVVSPGANALLTSDDVRISARAVTRADVLVIQLETPAEVALAAAEIARAAGKAVVLNVAPARRVPHELLRSVDVLVANRTEAAILLGMDPASDPARLALRLPELGPLTALLTLGSQGAILCHRGRPRRVPALEVQSVDSVGAGDAFVGALAAKWPPVHASRLVPADQLRHVEAAVVTAAVAGALATTTRGAIPSLPTREQIQPHLDKLKVKLGTA